MLWFVCDEQTPSAPRPPQLWPLCVSPKYCSVGVLGWPGRGWGAFPSFTPFIVLSKYCSSLLSCLTCLPGDGVRGMPRVRHVGSTCCSILVFTLTLPGKCAHFIDIAAEAQRGSSPPISFNFIHLVCTCFPGDLPGLCQAICSAPFPPWLHILLKSLPTLACFLTTLLPGSSRGSYIPTAPRSWRFRQSKLAAACSRANLQQTSTGQGTSETS